MGDTVDSLKEKFEQIRDERRKNANTAERIGNAFLSLLSFSNNLDSDKFLRKDMSDSTSYLQKFFGGINIGEFIDSMVAGKGTGITPDGRIQTDRLEVRDSMTVMDLIINQIQGMESDYSFSETGKITKVDFVATDTYKLWLDKRTDYDITKFQKNDVCFSIVNTVMTGGTDFYTSWMRVVAVNKADNAITVVMYSDKDVPGGRNYTPLSGYNITRRGNSELPTDGDTNERSQSWLLSSSEGRIMFLTNVFKPILEDYNYGLVIGRLPKTKALGQIPVAENDLGVMADVIIARHFYEFDGNGRLVTKTVDRGRWSMSVAIGTEPYRYMTHGSESTVTGESYAIVEQHTVWHYGCKWGCISDKTYEEPRWNAKDWVMLEGDPNYYVEIESSGGYAFRRSNVNTVLTARVYYGNTDITSEVVATEGYDCEWLRDTGRPGDDKVWTPEYVEEEKNAVHVDNGDMHGIGAGFGIDYKTVAFVCIVTIPVGGERAEKKQITGIIKFG